jgi:hypothetical protein
MKKIYSMLVLACMLFLINGCSKAKDSVDCSSLSQAVATAASTYSANLTPANCNAYKTAIQNYINGCSVITSAERESLNASLAALNCGK